MKRYLGFCLLLVILMASTLNAENADTTIGDYYATAALRALINTYQHSVSVRQISQLLIEADIAASTPAEEASLRELNRILNYWLTSPSRDVTSCYLALKANLKARNGATPEPCK